MTTLSRGPRMTVFIASKQQPQRNQRASRVLWTLLITQRSLFVRPLHHRRLKTWTNSSVKGNVVAGLWSAVARGGQIYLSLQLDNIRLCGAQRKYNKGLDHLEIPTSPSWTAERHDMSRPTVISACQVMRHLQG